MNMSKLLRWSISTVLAASLTACGGSSGTSDVISNGGGNGESVGTTLSSDSNESIEQNNTQSEDSNGDTTENTESNNTTSNDSDNQTPDTTPVVDNGGGTPAVVVMPPRPVVDTIAPTIKLNGGDKVFVYKGETYKDDGAIVSDNVDADRVVYSPDATNIDTSKNGVSFKIHYNASDNAKNKATIATRTVIVVENTRPIINVNTQNVRVNDKGEIEVPFRGEFKRPTYSAKDNSNIDLTSRVTVTDDVNVSKLGDYTITFAVLDSVGNETTETKKVIVKDLTAPVIKLKKYGSATNIVEVYKGSDGYEDPGIDVTDDVTLSNDIKIESKWDKELDIDKVGTYTLTYTATDIAGNKATKARTVLVRLAADVTAPTISLKGNKVINLVVNRDNYIEQGVTLVDDRAKPDLKTEGSVDTHKIGAYTVKYTAVDAAGNHTSIERTINVTDIYGNTIDLIGGGDITVSQDNNNHYSDAGIKTDDSKVDETLSRSDDSDVNLKVVGNYTLTYSATDSAGHKLQAKRMVHITDQTPPDITLQGTNPTVIREGKEFKDLGVKVTDNWKKDIEPTVIGEVDTSTRGQYTITYKATDGVHDVSVTRDVYVINAQDPKIILTDNDEPVKVVLGENYKEYGATATDYEDNDLTSKIKIDSSNVNTNKVGTYKVYYSVVDNSGLSFETKRNVEVVDVTPPVITLNGDSTVEVTIGNKYNELNVTVTDNWDKKPVKFTIDSSRVNTNTPGTYIVEYQAVDSSGNKAREVRRVYVSKLGGNGPSANSPRISVYPWYERVNYGEEYDELRGVSAEDSFGESIEVKADNDIDTTQVGRKYINYKAVDKYKNPTYNSRYVDVIDNHAPVIELEGDNPLNITVGDDISSYETGATVSDVENKNIRLKTANRVNTDKVGTYTITYSANDGYHSVSATRVVYVNDIEDEESPEISLIGKSEIIVDKESDYTDEGATAFDKVDGNLTSEIKRVVDSSNLKNNKFIKLIAYTYSVTDFAGNSNSVKRVVYVKDTKAPKITLLGNPMIHVGLGSDFKDPGAKVDDNSFDWYTRYYYSTIYHDKNDDFDINKVGTYTLHYRYKDPAGNENNITREVKVSY